MRSAPSNCEVNSYWPKYDLGIGTPSPSFLELLAPMGIRLIASTPQATATSTTPPATNAVARLVACWDEPHCVSTVVAATVIGRPAVSHAVRAMSNDCSPTWLTQPPMTCPTSEGSIPVRSISSESTVASRSAGCTVDRPPLRRPMGVRTASMITTSDIPASYGVGGEGRSEPRPLEVGVVAQAAAAERRPSS